MSIEDVLRRNEDSLFVKAKVQGQDIPSSLEGYEIDIQEIGTVTAQGPEPK
jgi:hypothetical protein